MQNNYPLMPWPEEQGLMSRGPTPGMILARYIQRRINSLRLAKESCEYKRDQMGTSNGSAYYLGHISRIDYEINYLIRDLELIEYDI